MQRVPVLPPSQNAVTQRLQRGVLLNNPCTSNPHTDNCLALGLSTAHIGPLRSEQTR